MLKIAMARTTKTLGFSVPPAVLKEVETLARKERRTKSELFREMVRVYQRFRLQRDRDEARWVENLIQEAKAEQAKNPMTTAAMMAESERLVRAAAKRAKKLGLKTDLRSATRLIHERRKTRRSA
jgi:metal-responsive CopG/Arc/MetJ family transcriptional regulator